MRAAPFLLPLLAVACSSPPHDVEQLDPQPVHVADGGGAHREAGHEEAGSRDAESRDAPTDAGGAETGTPCSVDGNPGACVPVAVCATMSGYSSTPGYCPGPADIECCALTPDVADNPPTPAGYELMSQSAVTPAMTAWAVAILDNPGMYPMFATATKVFGSQTVLARVEWHPPDFQNGAVHRGVTLYVPG